jgi:hypothetical protein
MDPFCSPDKNHLSPALARENVVIPEILVGDMFKSADEVVSKVNTICRIQGRGCVRPESIFGKYKGGSNVRFCCPSTTTQANIALYVGDEAASSSSTSSSSSFEASSTLSALPIVTTPSHPSLLLPAPGSDAYDVSDPASHACHVSDPAAKTNAHCNWHVVGVKGQSKKKNLKGVWIIKSVELLHTVGCACKVNTLTLEEALLNQDFVDRARGGKDCDIRDIAEAIFQHRPSQSFAQRIRKAIEASDNLLTLQEFKSLNSWLETFVELNPGSIQSFQRVGKKFASCMLAHGSILDITTHAAYKVFALDAGFTHVRGWRGQVFVLTVTDSNHEIFPLACGLYGVESGENYSNFLSSIKSVWDGRMGDLLNREDVIIFTDRHKAFSPALLLELPKANHMNDFTHIKRNMEDNARLNRGNTLGFTWGIATAKTKSEFDRKMAEFKILNEAAAIYLENIPVNSWATYTIIERGLKNFLKFGSNDVESEMHRFIRCLIRHVLPLRAMINYAKLVGKLLGERTIVAYQRVQAKKMFTERAETWLNDRCILAGNYHQ